MAQKLIDITGNKYNRLKVLGFDHIEKVGTKNRSFWKCQCDCGKIKVIRKDEFIYKNSHTKSCGCWHKEESSKRLRDKKTGKYIKNEEK